ncbi:MAG: cache domain-containing protein [Alkalispirochaeta sp.]
MPAHRGIPIRILLLLLTLAPLTVVVTIFGVLTFRTGRESVHHLTGQVAEEAAKRIEMHVVEFLRSTQLINTLNVRDVRQGHIDLADQQKMEEHFRRQVPIFPQVSSIYFGNTDGGLVGAGFEEGTRYVTGTEGFVAGEFYKRSVPTDPGVEKKTTIASISGFDARTRDWYTGAISTGTATWSEAYVLFTGHDMAIAASRPVYDRNGTVLGVFAVDVFLSQLSDYLANLRIADDYVCYIVDSSGLIIATSTDSPLVQQRSGAAEESRIPVTKHPSPQIRESANAIFTSPSNRTMVDIEGSRYIVTRNYVEEMHAPEWGIVVAIPESQYLGELIDTFQIAILVATLSGLIVLVVVFRLSWGVTQPVFRLIEALDRGVSGERPFVTQRSRVRELDHLIDSFLAMTYQIYSTMDRLNTEVTERNVLIRELNHRTKNNMNVISAMLRLRANALTDPDTAAVLGELDDRIQSMALVHQKLYQSESLAHIEMRDYLQDLIIQLRSSYGARGQEIDVRFAVDAIEMPIDLAVPTGLVVTELFSNAMRHAFPERGTEEAGEITVSLKRPSDDTVILSVSDNGVGLPVGFQPRGHQTLGFQMILTIVEFQLRGRVTFSTYPGVTCTCIFPMESE